MSKNVTLKEKNAPLLWSFFIFNCAVVVLLFFASNFEEFKKDYKTMFSLRSSGILIAPLILFAINGVLSSNLKAVLVFWRIKHVLPGARAFTHHGPKDPRVSISKLEAQYGSLPTSDDAQNELWYAIYKKHLKDITVIKSHKDFLLGRDITAIAFLFIFLVGIPYLFIAQQPVNWLYITGLVLQYLLFAIIAQNHGKRFVTNVLAAESTATVIKKTKKKDK